MYFETLILEKASLISYSQDELRNIATSSNHLREIVRNKPEFSSSFLGGSYIRGTMVKGVSDVDVYFNYHNVYGTPGTALNLLRNYLVQSYPNTSIKQDQPSILVDFDRIPFNITPYIKNGYSNTIAIPTANLQFWMHINSDDLNIRISRLRNKNPKYIEVIKILKLWNYNYNKGMKNYQIEEKICDLYLNAYSSDCNVVSCINAFFQNTWIYFQDAERFRTLSNYVYNPTLLKQEWLKFIDKK